MAKVNPNISFQEMAKLGFELLAKQKPVTLKQARSQVLRIKARSSNKNKEEEIKNLLRIYHPRWTEERNIKEAKRLIALYKIEKT